MVRLIKKYKNRRLYDTGQSKYITVEELRGLVVSGEPFQVQDSETGNDLTNQTLLQLLVEMQTQDGQFLSTEMLQQLIIFANHPMQKMFQETLASMFSSLHHNVEGNPLLRNFQKAGEQWQAESQKMFNKWQDMLK